MDSGIYAIKNAVNGKVYVGSSKNLSRRWKIHIQRLRNGTHHNRHLQAAFRRYGEGKFSYQLLEEVEEAELFSREQAWIDQLQSANHAVGYNISPTAECPRGCKHPEMSRWLRETGARKGSLHPGTSFTDQQVLDMCKRMDGGIHPSVIAEEHGVKTSTIQNIKWGTRWSHLTGRRQPGISSGENHVHAKLNLEKVQEIRKMLSEGHSQQMIGSFFGVSQGTISDINNGRTWK